jgi:hypothetical protein
MPNKDQKNRQEKTNKPKLSIKEKKLKKKAGKVGDKIVIKPGK